MKLNTSIAARRDGTVIVTGSDGAKYVFAADADGLMVCDVTDDALVFELLNGGNFFPTNEADFQAAMAIAKERVDAMGDGGGEDGPDDDEIVVGDGTPVESGTPPAPAGKRRRNAAPAA